MFERLPVLFRSAMYALRGGFLIRPLIIALFLGTAGAVLSWLEDAAPEISAWVPNNLFPSHEDPGVAQVIRTRGELVIFSVFRFVAALECVLINSTIGESGLINVRFGPLCGLKSDISRGPRSASSGTWPLFDHLIEER